MLGGKEFTEKIKPVLKGKSRLKEISNRERLVFRPFLEQLLGKEKQETKEGRNKAILPAHLGF